MVAEWRRLSAGKRIISSAVAMPAKRRSTKLRSFGSKSFRKTIYSAWSEPDRELRTPILLPNERRLQRKPARAIRWSPFHRHRRRRNKTMECFVRDKGKQTSQDSPSLSQGSRNTNRRHWAKSSDSRRRNPRWRSWSISSPTGGLGTPRRRAVRNGKRRRRSPRFPRRIHPNTEPCFSPVHRAQVSQRSSAEITERWSLLGKTSTAQLVCKALNMPYVEQNASDNRSQSTIGKIELNSAYLTSAQQSTKEHVSMSRRVSESSVDSVFSNV